MDRVLLTGANGHLGANLIRALLDLGYEVVPFVRPTSDVRGLEGLGLDYAYGDVRDGDSLVRAAVGCQAIVHSAAVFRYWAKDPAEIVEPSLQGAANVVKAAQANGVRRIIYTSSTYAIGFTPDFERPLTVMDWNENVHSPYAQAKTRAEREIKRLADEVGLELVVICSAGMWGPYDYRVTPPMRWIKDMVNGVAPIIDTGGTFIDVRDSAAIHALAIKQGEPGQRYVAGSAHLRQRDIAAIIKRLTGTRSLYLELPLPVMDFSAGLMEGWARLTGTEPMATRGFIRESLGRYQIAEFEGTNHHFGLSPRDAETMIADAIRWLLYRGEIGRRKARRLAKRFPPDPDWP